MNCDILDEDGKPIPRQSTRIVRLWECVRRTWKVWVPIVISIIIAVAALVISGLSYRQSAKNSEITHMLSKLDLRPRFKLYTLFKSTGKIPPQWGLTNTGPVEAVQVKVQMVSHRYFPARQMIQISLTGSNETTAISEIGPQATKSYAFGKGWLNTNARVQEPAQHNIMEIMVTYRRPQDLREYSESAYYFVNPDGLWVGERDSSLKGELYESMRTAVSKLDRGPFSVYEERSGDPLHPNQ